MSKIVYADGIHEIPNKDYHSSEGISRSMLMEFKRSPYHYWYKYLSGKAPKEEPTPAMILGNAVHTLVLEENKFDNEFYIIHQAKRPSKNTNPYEKMLLEANGRYILTKEEYITSIQMAQSIKEHEYASKLLEDCIIEQSIYFTHKTTGLQVKARPDAWSGHVVIDLKTSANACLKSFQGSSMNYGYFLQAAIINEAVKALDLEMEHFVFIAVEKEPPYCVGVYVINKNDELPDGMIMPSEALEYGVNQFNALMENLARCIEKNNWPGYGVQDLSLPAYAKYDEVLEIE